MHFYELGGTYLWTVSQSGNFFQRILRTIAEPRHYKYFHENAIWDEGLSGGGSGESILESGQ